MSEQRKPEIRFRGFTDDWEQRKFEEWGTFYYGHSCPKWSVTEDATVPCIRYGELYTKFGSKIDKVYSYTNIAPENLRFSKGTEVLIPRVGEDPMDYNHCTWLSLRDVAIGEMISVFNTEQDSLFSATMFNATLQKEFAIRVEGGSVTNLYFEKLKNIDISYPILAEQKKIAAFFEKLDHLITLHQRKHDSLTKIKKAMLEKMFPQDGATVPEIRFKGFTDDWEQRKFGEMADYKKGPFGSALKKEIFVPKSEHSVKVYEQQNAINKNWKLERYFITKEYANELRAFETHSGDILVSCAGTIGEMYELPDNSEVGVINQALMRVRVNENVISKKLYQLLFSNMIDDFSKEHSNGSAMKNIPPFADLKAMIAMIPALDEQERIGAYFEQLDHLITLHQRQLEKLQTIKKALLDKMFV